MKFTRNTVNGINDTILASNDYTAIPFTVTETAAVKAGYPMTLAGKKAVAAGETGSKTINADGILLYDVDPEENPNAALLIRGVIDTKKAAASSASLLTLTQSRHSRLPFLASSAVTTSA